MPLKHKALLLLALARAVFRPILAPLYGMSAVSGDKANGPSCVSTIIVIAHGGDGHPEATRNQKGILSATWDWLATSPERQPRRGGKFP